MGPDWPVPRRGPTLKRDIVYTIVILIPLLLDAALSGAIRAYVRKRANELIKVLVFLLLTRISVDLDI